MSYLRAIIDILRIDKLISGIISIIKKDPLEMMTYYIAILINICMIWFIWYVIKWLMFISC